MPCISSRLNGRVDILKIFILLCVTMGLIWPFSSRSFRHWRASEPLILSLSTSVATVTRRYDWTSLYSFSEVALSRMTACWALSLTVRRCQVSGVVRVMQEK